jgi:hypothetical protein
VNDVNERSTTFTPRYRITDVLSPDERYWYDAVDGGVPTIVTGPGSGSVSSGQAAVVKTWGADWEARLAREIDDVEYAWYRDTGPDRGDRAVSHDDGPVLDDLTRRGMNRGAPKHHVLSLDRCPRE